MNAKKIAIDFAASATPVAVALDLPPSAGRRTAGIFAIPVDFGYVFQTTSTPVIPNSRLVENLAATISFRQFRRAFEAATGLPLTLRTVEGWQPAHRGSRHENGFCALMYQANRSCAACLQVQPRVCDGVNGVPCTKSCAFGMTQTATGVNFTPHVSRVRVEKAKGLLPNLNYRVSDIAFGVGLQSLTHFNCVFKSVAGNSPTDFRRHLPAA